MGEIIFLILVVSALILRKTKDQFKQEHDGKTSPSLTSLYCLNMLALGLGVVSNMWLDKSPWRIVNQTEHLLGYTLVGLSCILLALTLPPHILKRRTKQP